MKKPALLILAIFISGLAHAQFYSDWTQAVAITDSFTINSNPEVLTIQENSNDIFCFYEKKLTPSHPSQIWYRNIDTMEEEQPLSMLDIYIYQNPQVLTTSYYDGRYFVFYESNETGNFEIYTVEFFEGGSFGEPIQLTYSVGDETYFSIGEAEYYHAACWRINDSIMFANIVITDNTIYFDEIKTIDSGDCFDPVCSEKMVFYRKMVNDSSQIYYSKFNSTTNLWSEPDTIYATGNNINLKMGGNSEGFYFFDESICWENNGKIICWDAWSEEISFLDFQGISECFEPSYITFDLITEEFPFPAIFTFCSGEDESKEIYTTIDYYYELQNISNNNYPDSKPLMFYGQFNSYYFNAINIWQTQKNDGRVLYMSQISIGFGGEKEKPEKTSNGIKVNTLPNPFKEFVNIEYCLSNSSQISINIYSPNGKHIDHINTTSLREGWNTCIWNPANELPVGIYFVVLKQGNETTIQKVIYTR